MPPSDRHRARFAQHRAYSASVAVLVCWLLGAATPAGATTGWRWPLAGRPVVSRGFDPPATPWGAGHRGVDLRARPGAHVLAAGGGAVRFAGRIAGIGVVTIAHPGGLETTYEPVAPDVRVGDRVAAGAVIGRVTAGHGDCGFGYVCLHWGLRRGVDYLDPLSLVGAATIRLFPVWTPAVVPQSRRGPPAAPGARVPASRIRSGRTGARRLGVAALGASAVVGAVAVSRRRRGGARS